MLRQRLVWQPQGWHRAMGGVSADDASVSLGQWTAPVESGALGTQGSGNAAYRGILSGFIMAFPNTCYSTLISSPLSSDGPLW